MIYYTASLRATLRPCLSVRHCHRSYDHTIPKLPFPIGVLL